jgi:hypothetical protein
LAATFPAPADFSGGIKGFLSPFLILTEAWEAIFKYNTNLGNALREVLGLPDEDFNNWTFSNDGDDEESSNALKQSTGVYKKNDAWTNSINMDSPTLQEILDKNRGVLYRTGEPPNFIGMSIGSIFSGPIYYLKNLITRLEYWKQEDKEPGLLDVLKTWLNRIDKKIQKIEEAISGIEKLIDLIDKILNISFTYLMIDSEGGVDDIMAQLEAASGFPNEEESQIILGMVIGYSADGSGFDMSAYFNSINMQNKEERDSLFADLRIQTEEDGNSYLNKFFGGAKKAPGDFL